MLVTLKVSPAKLGKIIDPQSVKEDSPIKEDKEIKETVDSPAPAPDAASVSGSQPPASNSNGDNASDSNVATPAADATPADGTPVPSVMGPPAEGPKKKGVKRSAAGSNNNTDGSKPRGKPGPKKKPRLEDGTIDHSGSKMVGGHKLGPKANQGAINAGLRALDRSGKPCRRWDKGGFKLKSFTGIVWEVPRWTAPPKKLPESGNEESSAVSAEDTSSKENKENGQEGNSVSNSNTGVDVEMQSPQPSVHAPSPAPVPVAAAS